MLTSVPRDEMPEQDEAWYVHADGGLRPDRLLAAFQEFFRDNSEHWVERARYREAGPQLVLQAFLHRVVNGGSRIEREYALGSGRVDLSRRRSGSRTQPPDSDGQAFKVARVQDGDQPVEEGIPERHVIRFPWDEDIHDDGSQFNAVLILH